MDKLRTVAVWIGGFFIACFGGLSWWLHVMTTYYTDSYKPVHLVEAADEAALQDRFWPSEFPSCTVFLEWFTYDNDDITTGPYKLFLVIQPGFRFEKAEVVDVEVTSSLGRVHRIDFSGGPVVLQADPSGKRVSHTFEPAFPFDFAAGEVITSRVTLRIVADGKAQRAWIKTEWRPVRVRHWTSIV